MMMMIQNTKQLFFNYSRKVIFQRTLVFTAHKSQTIINPETNGKV